MPVETPFPGLAVVDMPVHEDERGSFARLYCRTTFESRGLAPVGNQWSLSRNPIKGTLRGLHYQAAPHEETKLVRCVKGAIFDVVVDMRPDHPTFGQHYGIELSERNRKSLYVPRGFAHGFMTLEDDSEVLYGISPDYVPSAARGLRWNDPSLNIPWPMAPTLVSPRDAAFPLWNALF